ncbi:hypothetical protein [Synechococcus sp. M16CYN]
MVTDLVATIGGITSRLGFSELISESIVRSRSAGRDDVLIMHWTIVEA